MTVAVSWGRYGGFYFTRSPGFCYRVCVGWVALTWLRMEIDDVMRMAAK